MSIYKTMEECFCQDRNPKKTPRYKTDPEGKNTSSTKEIGKFLGLDVLSILGQPTKRSPKMNNNRKIEEPLSPEMEEEIKKVFWENFDKFTY